MRQIDRDHWTRVELLFDRALEGTPAERDMSALGKELPEVRLAVAKMLRAHDSGLGLTALDHPQFKSGKKQPTAAALHGHCLGPYRLNRELGRGGSSVVYLASRTGAHYERQVAIKILSSNSPDAEAKARLRRERQILADFDHPNIPRLLDGGTTQDGRPFLVLELVKGANLLRHCEENRLTVGERVDLFSQVCSAVSFAHRRLVIHRDIKAENIVVSDSGVPKLLDFGIAKLMDAGGDLATLTEGLGPMTLIYASPEQLRGKPVTTGCDIYSLGVLLLKLLLGKAACLDDIGGAVAARLRLQDPPSPGSLFNRADADTQLAVSTARSTFPRTLRRLLAGDLGAITAKAVRCDPSARYMSVDELADDLRWWRDPRSP